MKQIRKLCIIAVVLLVACVFTIFSSNIGFSAYTHFEDTDSAVFRGVYPNTVGTKLDSCATCHRGSSKAQGDPVTYGSCQWCHYITKYGADATPGNLDKTLNSYGRNYRDNGRSAAALGKISGFDSDGDGFTNQIEIVALTYPGDKSDDPTKVPAPSRIISLKELEDMPLHTQFLLMNASKSDDNYTEYSGVALENLIKAVMLDSATDGITVYSPDGFATDHPFNPSTSPNSYHVFGIYPPSLFYYDTQADMATNPSTGWCNYSSPSAAGREDGSAIFNPEGLKMLLAFERDGEYLAPGVLNPQHKLDGEGPFRVVPPQKNPGPPDQRSTATKATDPAEWVWPYCGGCDHNAGFSSRTVTMIKVKPLPPGTTDVNTLEAGWPYVDEKKIVVYGSIDPYPVEKLNSSLDDLIDTIESLPDTVLKVKSHKKTLVNKIEAIKKQVANGAYSAALNKLKEDVLKKMDGYLSGAVDANDWIKDLDVQKQLCSEIQTIWIMLVLIGA